MERAHGKNELIGCACGFSSMFTNSSIPNKLLRYEIDECSIKLYCNWSFSVKFFFPSSIHFNKNKKWNTIWIVIVILGIKHNIYVLCSEKSSNIKFIFGQSFVNFLLIIYLHKKGFLLWKLIMRILIEIKIIHFLIDVLDIIIARY